MARPYPTNTQLPRGKVTVRETTDGCFSVTFIPPQAVLSGKQDPEKYKRKILEIYAINRKIVIYPYKVWGQFPMVDKYESLKCIIIELDWEHDFEYDDDNIEEFISEILPGVFISDCHYGLGLKRQYKPIVNLLDGLRIEQLTITDKEATCIKEDKKTALMNVSDFYSLVRNINYITDRAQKASFQLKSKTTGELFSRMLELREINGTDISVESLQQLITGANRRKLGKANVAEQEEAIETVTNNSKRIIKENPSALLKLRNDIDLVNLEDLIGRFESMLTKHSPEWHWQRLLEQNPYLLSMTLGLPVIKVRGQLSVGGHRFDGKGNKITDFLVKHAGSNNAAIIEIKHPGTTLLSTRSYRDGIYGPHSDVTAAVNQILDQIYIFQRDINTLKAASKQHDIETYRVEGVLIAGRFMDGEDKKKSFELFRGNSKLVQILTFDELLWKLKDLYTFLKPESLSASDEVEEEDQDGLPF